LDTPPTGFKYYLQYQVPLFNRHFRPLFIMNDSLYDLPGGEKFPRDNCPETEKRGNLMLRCVYCAI